MKKSATTYIENQHRHENYFPETFPNLRRCPFCSVSRPTLICKHRIEEPVKSEHFGQPVCWAVYQCTSCSLPISLVYSSIKSTLDGFRHEYIVSPGSWSVDSNIPPLAARFLTQAQDTLNSPDASVVMSASAIDAMLKAKGLKDGSLYNRIDKAVESGLLTSDMSKWAHLVRLNSNNPRHADDEAPQITVKEAQLSLDYAKAISDVLFVLPSRIPKDSATER